MVTKRLVDIDDQLLHEAQAELGTSTIKATVNEALARAAEQRRKRIARSIDFLATFPFVDREEAWR